MDDHRLALHRLTRTQAERLTMMRAQRQGGKPAMQLYADMLARDGITVVEVTDEHVLAQAPTVRVKKALTKSQPKTLIMEEPDPATRAALTPQRRVDKG